MNIEQILGHYGLLDTLRRKGDSLVGPCPIHKGSNPTGFHVSLTKNNYNCFGNCHGGGNIIDFVCGMEKLNRDNQEDFRKAALLIQEWFFGNSAKVTLLTDSPLSQAGQSRAVAKADRASFALLRFLTRQLAGWKWTLQDLERDKVEPRKGQSLNW